MDPVETARVVESFERCLEKSDFFDRFYKRFLDSSPEIAKRFENTDFERQNAILKDSLYSMIIAAEMQDVGIARANLTRIAKRHSKADLDIRPELYSLWLDCLVETIEECDPKFDGELGVAWRQVMQTGIDFMQERY